MRKSSIGKSANLKQTGSRESQGKQLNGSMVIGVSISPENQSFQKAVEQRFSALNYNSSSQEQIEQQIRQIRNKIRQFEEITDKKISKYYSQLRQALPQTELTQQQRCQILKMQISICKQLLEFQGIQVVKIKEQQAAFDAIKNIEFTIPIQISVAKKKIVQMSAFIDMATIKQKRKSQQLVKVEINNQLQFQKTAMLRKHMQIAMLYEMDLNQKQLKLDQNMYSFQTKLQTLNKRFAELTKTAQEKSIVVSSNKLMVQLKEKKNILHKQLEDIKKKIAICNNNQVTSHTMIKRDIEHIRKEMTEKDLKIQAIRQSLEDVSTRNNSFMLDQSLTKSLRKSISYNYAETLLKMKAKVKPPQENTNAINSPSAVNNSPSAVNSSLILKPNFKVKKVKNQLSLSVDKIDSPKKNTLNEAVSIEIASVTLELPVVATKVKGQAAIIGNQGKASMENNKAGTPFSNKKEVYAIDTHKGATDLNNSNNRNLVNKGDSLALVNKGSKNPQSMQLQFDFDEEILVQG